MIVTLHQRGCSSKCFQFVGKWSMSKYLTVLTVKKNSRYIVGTSEIVTGALKKEALASRFIH